MFGWKGKGVVGSRMASCQSPAMLLHDKHQPGASCDKALIQQIPPSFAENPNEDLKCSAGRRPRGCGYTLPLLALPAIVPLSPYWLRLAGDERALTAWWAFAHRPHAGPAPWEARFHSLPQTTRVTSSRRGRGEPNRSCLLRTQKETKGKIQPFSL